MSQMKSKENAFAARSEIRVIKKSDIGKMERATAVDKQSKNRVARQMVSAVKNWVSEFESRQLEEIKLITERFQHNF